MLALIIFILLLIAPANAANGSNTPLPSPVNTNEEDDSYDDAMSTAAVRGGLEEEASTRYPFMTKANASRLSTIKPFSSDEIATVLAALEKTESKTLFVEEKKENVISLVRRIETYLVSSKLLKLTDLETKDGKFHLFYTHGVVIEIASEKIISDMYVVVLKTDVDGYKVLHAIWCGREIKEKFHELQNGIKKSVPFITLLKNTFGVRDITTVFCNPDSLPHVVHALFGRAAFDCALEKLESK